MPLENSEIMNKARVARDKLVSEFINHPDVALIGIGIPPDTGAVGKVDEIVIKIHVREHWMKSRPDERLVFPTEVDGFRVVVIPGDFHLDSGASAINQE